MGQTVPNNQQTNNQYSLFNSQVGSRAPNSSLINSINNPGRQNYLINSKNGNQNHLATPLSSSQILPYNQVNQQLKPISTPPGASLWNTLQPQSFGSQSVILPNVSVQIIFSPELGPTGSSFKKSNDVPKNKRVNFQSGLQQLLTLRQHLRSAKQYFSKIYPIMEQELSNIRDAVQTEMKAGIPDKSKIFYHLAQQKNYKSIFHKISQCKENITMSIDLLRKKESITKQQFLIIISIAKDASAFVKRLALELPTNGWKAILSSNNTNLYNKLVSLAQNDKQILQIYQTLQVNCRNPNFRYIILSQTQNLYQSRTFSLIQGPTQSPKRPSTPLVKHPSYIY